MTVGFNCTNTAEKLNFTKIGKLSNRSVPWFRNLHLGAWASHVFFTHFKSLRRSLLRLYAECILEWHLHNSANWVDICIIERSSTNARKFSTRLVRLLCETTSQIPCIPLLGKQLIFFEPCERTASMSNVEQQKREIWLPISQSCGRQHHLRGRFYTESWREKQEAFEGKINTKGTDLLSVAGEQL